MKEIKIKPIQTQKLVHIYLEYHKASLISAIKKRGHEPKPYKDLEIDKLKRIFNNPPSEKLCILDFATYLMSNLLRMHSLPNANHRTSISFIQAFLKANGIDLPEYNYSTNKEKWVEDCNKYIRESKYWLKLSRNRKKLLKDYEQGNNEIEVGDGVTKKIKIRDLGLTRGEYRNKHRKITKNWLEEMLSSQSAKYSKESSNSLSRFIAHSDKSKSSKLI